MKPPALLVLEDGSFFRGWSCGAQGTSGGELVFNTSMTGYQEVLTDPSYAGQLVVMTYPMIGNYGVTAVDDESHKTFLEGFVVREMTQRPSNWQAVGSLPDFLRRHRVPAIEGVDTRALTLRLREKGALRCALSTEELDVKRLLARARAVRGMVGCDLAGSVSCPERYAWTEKLPEPPLEPWPLEFPREPHVVVMDFGVKYGMLRCLASMGCRVSVVPARTPAPEILALRPDGILLSNGPGDPEPMTYAVEAVRRLLDTGIPLFGICLGHQLLGLAFGGRTFKLKFGHHGANHPVLSVESGRIAITTQNHNFCVDLASLPKEVRTTHLNLNDKTSEGMAHSQLPVFSVQYHPEAAAGPHDARGLFTRFGSLMSESMAAARRAGRGSRPGIP